MIDDRDGAAGQSRSGAKARWGAVQVHVGARERHDSHRFRRLTRRRAAAAIRRAQSVKTDKSSVIVDKRRGLCYDALMSGIAIITGSVSARSKTAALAARIAARLGREGFRVTTVNVRDLPAEDVLFGRVDSPAVADAARIVAEASGVVIATPIYKASYTGALKAFLDLLPQFGLAGKAVLPLATGGTLAHVLAIDYGLRPVLQSLGARHVLPGLFLLDKALRLGEDGALEIDDELGSKLEEVVRPFIDSVLREGLPLPARDVAA